jgi:hypothetical protein
VVVCLLDLSQLGSYPELADTSELATCTPTACLCVHVQMYCPSRWHANSADRRLSPRRPPLEISRDFHVAASELTKDLSDTRGDPTSGAVQGRLSDRMWVLATRCLGIKIAGYASKYQQHGWLVLRCAALFAKERWGNGNFARKMELLFRRSTAVFYLIVDRRGCQTRAGLTEQSAHVLRFAFVQFMLFQLPRVSTRTRP